MRATDSNGTAWGTPVTVSGAGMWCDAVSLEVINGRPAIVYNDSVNAYYGVVRYRRATDSTGSAWGSAVQVSAKLETAKTLTLAVVNGYPVVLHHSENGFAYVHALDQNGASWMAAVNPYPDGGLYADLEIIKGHPTVCHYMHGPKLIYQRSSDIDGLTWFTNPDTPTVVLEPTAGQYCSMVIAAGYPAVCFHDYYMGNISLKYRRAQDEYGNSWDAAQVLDSGSYNIGLHSDMDLVFGIPYICYAEYDPTPNLKAITAQDGQGSTWSAPEIVAKTNVNWTSVYTVSNWPALAYVDGYGLRYGIKYQ